MRSKEFRRLGGIACLLLFVLTSYAQYTVSGGNGNPLMAKKVNDLQVYLLDGMQNAEIRYTAATNSKLQWYRYKTKALEAEPVTGTQSGNTTILSNPEEGYGYYVAEPGKTNRYVWLSDYSKNAFSIQSLSVSPESDCDGLRLTGTAGMNQIFFYTPSDGIRMELKRVFEITYNTLKWNAEEKRFTPRQETVQVEGNPFTTRLEAPLCDTDIRLSGDLFARHFNKEKSMSTGQYEAVAIEAHADTTLIADNAANLMNGTEGLSAPVEVHFTAYANAPVASLYIWKIYPTDDPQGAENPLVRFTGEEVDYTFSQKGSYTASLEVSNRTGKCSVTTESIIINIRESDLQVPNAFSPGTSPGVNDEFRVAYKSLTRFQGWIFNRWGVEMFRWSNPAQGWDGKKGGQYVTPGVYFYVIEAEGSDGIKYKRKGDINILRSKIIQDEVVK